MVQSTENKSTLVLGLGNLLLGDEGWGVHVVQKLQTCELPAHVRVFEGGVGGYNLLGCLEGVERLLVVDAMMTEAGPGELVLFQPGPDFRDNSRNALSFHQIGILELVQMWKLLGHEPEVYFLVARPEKLDPGMDLSPRLQESVGPAVQLILKLCHNRFSGLERSAEVCTR
jgi:hydrogenase maturation protease